MRGCEKHGSNLYTCDRGNPRTNYGVRESFVRCRKMLSEHTVLGCFQLMPGDFLTIRKALLSSGKLSDLKLYCICLISTFLFLRASEVL
jgi:hypothetical protein